MTIEKAVKIKMPHRNNTFLVQISKIEERKRKQLQLICLHPMVLPTDCSHTNISIQFGGVSFVNKTNLFKYI